MCSPTSSRSASDSRDLARQFLSIVIVHVFYFFFAFLFFLFLWAWDLRFPSKAGVVIEFNGVEPCLDVFAGLAVLPDALGKPGRVSPSLSGPRPSIYADPASISHGAPGVAGPCCRSTPPL